MRIRENGCKLPLLSGIAFLLVLIGAPDGEAFHIGRIEVAPRVALEGVYDDNVLLRAEGDPANPVLDDWSARVRPGITFSYAQGPTDFSLGYSNEFIFYDRFTDRDNYHGRNHRLSFSTGHTFGERTSIGLTDSLLIGTDVAEISEQGLEDVEQAGILPRQRDYRRNRAGIDFSHALTRKVSLTASGAYGYFWYDEAQQNGVQVEPTTEEQQGSVHLSTSYAWHPSNSINASVGFTYMDFDQRGNSKIYVVSLGDSWQITRYLSISGSGGLEYLQETVVPVPGTGGETREDEAVSPYGSLRCNYLLHEELNATLSFYYGYQDSSGLGTTVTSRSVRFGLDYNPLSGLTIRAFGLYSKSEPAEEIGGPDIESIQGGASVAYELLSWVSTSLRYNYIDQKAFGAAAAGVGESYKDNRFSLGVTLTLPERIR